MEVPQSLRSRETFWRKIAAPLAEQGYPKKIAACVAGALQELLLSDKKLSGSDFEKISTSPDPFGEIETAQVTVLGEPEVNYLKQFAGEIMDGIREELGSLYEEIDIKSAEDKQSHKACCDAILKACSDMSKGDLKKNLKALSCAAGLDAAMFGRMATSDVLARGDAAVHVAHSFTTHAEESESDYFSAVDELKAFESEGELGSGHINTSELNSGLFYGYLVVDVPLLVSNIEGCSRKEWESADRSLAAEVVNRLVQLVATVTPGAKLGSTAPYACSECVLLEMGNAQPRTLANAFRKAVDESPDVLENSYSAMAAHIRQLDEMYGCTTERRLSAAGQPSLLCDVLQLTGTVPLSEAAAWVAAYIRG